MDLNPLIPNATTTHDVAHILSESFEDTLRECIPKNIAENIRRNKLDEDYQDFKQYAEDIKEFSDAALDECTIMQSLEAEMMIKQGQNLIIEKTLEDNPHLKDNMLLRRHGYFESYPFNAKKYNLIDKNDILPSKMEQVLDFTYSYCLSPHNCQLEHCVKRRKPVNVTRPVIVPKDILEKCDLKISTFKEEATNEPIKIDPKEIIFDDFELNTIYKRKVRVQNCTSRKRNFFFTYPKNSPISLKVMSDKEFLAPGMYVDILVTYYTEIYHNVSTEIEFTTGAYKTVLKISSFRKPPHLRVYIFRSLKFFTQRQPHEDCEFWGQRCTALNDTIDCGHCFIGDYNYLSLIIGNVGTAGQFFCLTEEEWLTGNVNNIDRSMQFTKDCFKIFPSFISINQDEIAEICVTFTPNTPGLHVEKLYLIADNNTSKAVEILGDGLYFTRSMIQVFFKQSPHFKRVEKIGILDDVNEELPSYHAFQMDYIANLSSNTIIFEVRNKSAIYLNFYWTFRNKENDPRTLHLDPKCVNINLNHDYLSPYSTYYFQVNIVPDVEEVGHYSILLGFHIAKVPLKALEEGEEFTIHSEIEFDNIQFCDIQICEIELGCEVYFEEEKPPVPPLPKICDCPKPPVEPKRKLKFSTSLMDFGVIPIGVDLEREIDIIKLKGKQVKWFITEVVYDADIKPSMFIAKKPCTNKSSGTLTAEKCTLKYLINAKKPKRRVSMLLLFTGKLDETLHLNSTCIITYEVIKWKIKIYSEESKRPIVTSSKLHYLGILCRWKFFIKNYSPLVACFWLLPPIGEDVDKLEMKFYPKHGIIRPGEKITVNITAVPKDVGIIEKVFVPCFYSKNCDPIIIRFICVVDDINVYFYIPSQCEGYDKILWPPKVLNDVDLQQTNVEDYVCAGEGSEGNLPFSWGSIENIPSASSDYTDILSRIKSDSSSSELMESSKMCERSIFSHMSSTSYIMSLGDFLRERHNGDFMKQDYVVEVRNITLKTPHKISIYIENITPIYAEFIVEPTNFAPPCDCPSDDSLGMFGTTPEESCKKSGIIVVPQPDQGALEPSEVRQICLWFYATTWGIYSEEIVVKINEISSFSFNLLIEVIGAPIEFPIAIKTIRQNPTMRFGPISYVSEAVSKILKFKNISCIPLSVQWFLFNASPKSQENQYFNTILDMVDKNRKSSDEEIRLFLSKRYYGQPDISFLQVDPKCVEILPREVSEVVIKIDPQNLPSDYDEKKIIGNLIGYVFISDKDKSQKNLLYRKSGDELKPLYMEIIADIIMPILNLDLLSGDTTVTVNATRIMDGENEDKLIALTLKNNNPITSSISFHIEQPFEIVDILMRDHERLENTSNAIVKPGDVVVIHLKCLLTFANIIDMANWIYRSQSAHKDRVCMVSKRIKIKRHLNIHQRGAQGQTVPLICEVQYPRIDVKPKFLKFKHVNLNMTKRLCISLYNTTDVGIKFEIHQSAQLPEFTVEPTEGVLPPSFGPKNSLTEICVYFTPTCHNFFQESLIIQTRIPQCLLIVPLNGYGIQNEKFNTNRLLQ